MSTLRPFDASKLIQVFEVAQNERLTGQASHAARFFGYDTQTKQGPSGQGYALPVYSDSKLLPKEMLVQGIEALYTQARTHPNQLFKLPVLGLDAGQGAGLTTEEVASRISFAAELLDSPNRPSNLILPGVYRRAIDPNLAIFCVCGLTNFSDERWFLEKMEATMSRLGVNRSSLILCTSDASGTSEIARKFGYHHQLPTLVFEENPTLFKQASRVQQHLDMLWYCTHLLLFWDGASRFWKGLQAEAASKGISSQNFTYSANLDDLDNWFVQQMNAI